MNLKDKLIALGRTRWLDVGCGGTFEELFFFLDILNKDRIPHQFRHRYIQLDIVRAAPRDLRALGQFDLVRLQHSFEHLSYEDGKRALQNCAALLNETGMIMITTPDLRIHARTYLAAQYKQGEWNGYRAWANNRIPKNSPDSFYFSAFAHSMLHEPHKWCYDFDGLRFQLETSGRFDNIQELSIDHPLSAYPFTHNRPNEDVCVIAEKLSDNRSTLDSDLDERDGIDGKNKNG